MPRGHRSDGVEKGEMIDTSPEDSKKDYYSLF